MRSYKYNRVHAASFACSTDTSTLSYDQPAQCYRRLLSTDGSRWLSAITDDRTFIWAVIVADQLIVLLSTLLNLQCFSNPQFPVSFSLTVSSNDTDNGLSGSVAVRTSQSRTGKPKKVGSAINRSLISAYFLTVQTYKCMCLATQVYGTHSL